MNPHATRFFIAIFIASALSGCISIMPPQRDKRPSFMVACSRTSSEVSSRLPSPLEFDVLKRLTLMRRAESFCRTRRRDKFNS